MLVCMHTCLHACARVCTRGVHAELLGDTLQKRTATSSKESQCKDCAKKIAVLMCTSTQEVQDGPPLQAEICSIYLTRTTVRPLLSAMLPSDAQTARVFETSEVPRESCIHKFQQNEADLWFGLRSLIELGPVYL